jgi:hypothetical protein
MEQLDREAARTAGSEMKNLADCDECRAILDAFRDSLGEVERLKDEVGTNADSVEQRLAEEDGADRLEALHNLHDQLSESHFKNPRCPGFARAMKRMLAHYQRTGHYISVRELLGKP